MKVCATPGCPNLTTTTHCPQHEHQRRRQADQKRARHSHYGNRRWRTTRRNYLKHHPLCECGCGKIATVVHHRDGQGLQGPRAHDPSNLQALAKPCHDQLTAVEQPAGWNNR